MDHADLVAEMHTVENLPTQDRLHLARMRRAQQLKVARQKEKEWQKMQSRRDRSLQHSKRNRRHIIFENSVVLLEAAGRNDISEVNQLLQRGITPDASNEDGLTALHQCCIDNNIDMLKLLLDYGANVDAQDSDKWTPLHAAATCGHLHLVKILISRGANLLAVNTDGNMPYDLCDDEDTLDYIEAEMSKRGVTQELIDDTRALTEKQMLSDLMELTNSGGDLDIPDHQGATPLHIAAANGYTRVVEFLLEHHASVDAVDKDMWSPVHAAACWGHPEVLELLAQYGADLNAKNKDNETPSDICEDSEIRERIEQLKTEQESKRLAEAQRRRVRRSQSNNTRAQSVRRTSLRDKTLTTKKDAVEETRLRLQAQEVFVTPDSTTESKSISNGTEQTSSQTQRSAKNPSHTAVPNNNTHESEISSRRHLSNSSGNIGDFSTSSRPEITSTTKAFLSSSAISNPDITGQIQHSTSSSAIMNNNNSNHSISNHANNNNNTTNHNNNINNNSNNNNNHSNSGSSSSASRLNGSTGITSSSSVQSSGGFGHSTSYPSHIMETSLNSRRPPEGKDNEEFPIRDKMLINSSSSVSNLHKLSNDRSTEIFSASKENGKINVQVTVLVDNSLSGTTLANLKKQRSQSRSSTISENGSVIAATSHSITAAGEAPSSPISANPNPVQPIELVVSSSASDPQSSPVTKFSGVTGDVVSDSTRSKKCCILM